MPALAFSRSALLCCALCCSTTVAHAQEPHRIKIRAGTVAPQGTPWEAQMRRTSKHLQKDFDNQVKVKIYFGGQKGDEKSIVRQCRDGRLEMVGVSTAALATVVPELQALELPFLFASSAEADFVLDNYLYKPVAKILKKYGFIMYQWAENGWHNIGLKKGFANTPTALRGLKMRAQEARVHLLTWQALGASPVGMAVSEVLPALKTGLVDGFSQTPLFTFAVGWHQAIKTYTLTRHIYQPGIIAYSKKFFDRFTAQEQAKLLANIQQDTESGRRGVRKLEPGLIANFRNYGIQVRELSPQERAAFLPVAKKIKQEFAKQASPGALEILRQIEAGKKAFAKQAKPPQA